MTSTHTPADLCAGHHGGVAVHALSKALAAHPSSEAVLLTVVVSWLAKASRASGRDRVQLYNSLKQFIADSLASASGERRFTSHVRGTILSARLLSMQATGQAGKLPFTACWCAWHASQGPYRPTWPPCWSGAYGLSHAPQPSRPCSWGRLLLIWWTLWRL